MSRGSIGNASDPFPGMPSDMRVERERMVPHDLSRNGPDPSGMAARLTPGGSPGSKKEHCGCILKPENRSSNQKGAVRSDSHSQPEKSSQAEGHGSIGRTPGCRPGSIGSRVSRGIHTEIRSPPPAGLNSKRRLDRGEAEPERECVRGRVRSARLIGAAGVVDLYVRRE